MESFMEAMYLDTDYRKLFWFPHYSLRRSFFQKRPFGSSGYTGGGYVRDNVGLYRVFRIIRGYIGFRV